MARFFGKVGFGHTKEIEPGVMEDVINEREFFGDVLRPSRNFDDTNVIPGTTPANRISIVADDVRPEDVFAIRFVAWKGVLWSVKGVVEERPRLILSLGEVYNGPTAGPSVPTPL